MNCVLRLVGVLVMLMSVPAPAQAQLPANLAAAMTEGHALLIGVSDYRDRRWGKLASIPAEIAELQQGLRRHFTTVDPPLLNPTVGQLRDRLREFLLETYNDDNARLFVFYAGHGFTARNESAGTDVGYITGIDTPDFTADRGGALNRAISFQEIDAINNEAHARQVLMAFDSCFSGSLFLTRSADTLAARYNTDYASRMLRQPIRYFLTAGREDQEVPVDSPFATMLLRGLDGAADKYGNGFITGEDLGRYLKETVPAVTHGQITPQYGPIANAPLSRGQFVFLTQPPLPLPAAPIVAAPQPPAEPTPAATLQIVPAPPPDYYRGEGVPVAPDTRLRLKLASEKRNQITDEEAWWQANGLDRITYKTPNPLLGNPQTDVPDGVPRRLDKLILTRAIRSNPVIALYGRDFSDARIMLVVDAASGAVRHALDFSNYTTPYKVKETEKAYVGMEVRWGMIEGDTLYFSYAHRTYAASSMGYNAYVAALDLPSNRLLWQSKPLTDNAENFVVKGDAIVTGYGFTAEKRFIYVLNKADGRSVASLPIHNYPDYFVEKDGKLFVRTYDTDYVFNYTN